MPSDDTSQDCYEVDEYDVHLRRMRLPMGLRVDEVRLSGKSLVVREHPFQVSAAEAGSLRVHVSDASLAQFLEERSPAGLRKFHVTSENGKLVVKAIKKVLVDLKVHAVCALEIRKRQSLYVLLESVDVAGADIRNLIQAQLNELNPVIDAGMFPFRAELLEAVVDRGGISLIGHVMP